MPRKKAAPNPGDSFVGEIDPEREYRITLRHPVEWGNARLLPRNGVMKVKGKVILAHREAVVTVEAI